MKKIIKELNDLRIKQFSYEYELDIPKEIFDKYFSDAKLVDSELSISKHRWYETSISVYQFKDGLLGMEVVTDVFSEAMDYSDCSHVFRFSEMEEYTITSYKRKKDI